MRRETKSTQTTKIKKRKSPMLVIVDKPNGQHIFGSFPQTKDGKLAAEKYLEKIKSESAAPLLIEKR